MIDFNLVEILFASKFPKNQILLIIQYFLFLCYKRNNIEKLKKLRFEDKVLYIKLKKGEHCVNLIINFSKIKTFYLPVKNNRKTPHSTANVIRKSLQKVRILLSIYFIIKHLINLHIKK